MIISIIPYKLPLRALDSQAYLMKLTLSEIHEKLEEFEVKLQQIEETNRILSRQIKETFLLYDAVQKLNKTKYYKEVAHAITSILRGSFHVDEFAVFIFDPRPNVLNIRFSNGIPKRDIKEFFYRPNEGFVGKAFSTGEVIYVPDLSAYQKFRYYQSDRKVQGCALYIPLNLSPNETIGVLKLRRPLPDSFTDMERNVLNQLSEPIAIAIHNGLTIDEISHHAWIDELTGLLTVKYFKRRYHAEIRRAQRYQHPLSIVAISIENMGEIFRRHGKDNRDLILKAFASFLEENTRMCDICFRYSVNQFLILLPETTKNAAEKAMQKILNGWEEEALRIREESAVAVKLAMRYANYPKDTIEPPLLLRMALEGAEKKK